jgi:hypothetical protein
MSKYEVDIDKWIKDKYPDVDKAQAILEPILSMDTAICTSRIIRCALYLSDSDYDSLIRYVKKALDDPRNVLWYAEYDNRDVQKRDFSRSFSSQKYM